MAFQMSNSGFPDQKGDRVWDADLRVFPFFTKRHSWKNALPQGCGFSDWKAFRFESEQRNESLQVRTCKVGVRERPDLTGAVERGFDSLAGLT